MKKYVFNLMQFGCVAFLLSCVAFPAHAFNFLLFSNYKSTFQAYYGLEGVESTQDLLTAPSICSIDEAYKIKANDLQGYRFKGWFTKKAGWGTNDATADSVDATPFVSTPEIAGAQINSADVGTSSLSGLKTIVAKYVRLYDISTAVNPADAGSVSGAEAYEEGGSATLEAKPNAGWAFWYWKEDNNTSNPRTISNISAAATYTAVFKPLFKTLSLEKGGGSGGTDSVVVTNDMAMPKITVPTKVGYDFLGYFTAESGDGATQYYTAGGTSAKSWSAGETVQALYARWQAKSFTVKFNNGGATSGPNPLTVTYGKDPGPLGVVPSMDGYKFSGYYLGDACYWNASGEWVGGSGWAYVPSEGTDVILTARYTAEQYTVKFNANGGVGSYDDLFVAINATFVMPDGKALSKANHKFCGWARSSGGEKVLDGGASTTVMDNKGTASQNPNLLTFYAVWIDLSCTVHFNGGSDEATVSMETKVAQSGAAFGELATATWSGERCTLAGWWDEEGRRIVETSIIPEGRKEVNLSARWTTNGYSIAYHANGGTGEMSPQKVPFNASVALRRNQFACDGHQFAGWATNATGGIVYQDNDTVKDLATTKDAVVNLYAKWSTNSYQVVFYGNGGTNEMAKLSFQYDVAQGLTSNRFVREGFTFAGWATDPTNGVAYADGATVSNLTTIAGGVAPLYAKWTANGEGIDSELSAAIGCDSVNLTTNNFGWVIAPGEGKDGGNALRTKAGDFNRNDKSHEMSVLLVGRGTLRFRCMTDIEAPPIFKSTKGDYKDGDPSQFGFYVGGDPNEDVMPIKADKSEWAEYKYDKISDGSEIISWRIEMFNKYHDDIYRDYGPSCGSDDDYALIDFVRWEPAETNALMVGVTFRDAEGGVFTNVTRAAGEAYGELPVPTDARGRKFIGWECEGTTIDETWLVPNAEQGVEILSRWGEVPIVTNAVPQAVGGLTYTGWEQLGVPEGDGYAIVGNVGTNAGSYTAWLTPIEYHVWEGGFGGATNIEWTIAKAVIDLGGVTFVDATYEHDGESHSIAATGVPPDVKVSYSGDPTERSEPGTNVVTVTFAAKDATNYATSITNLTAKLVILGQEEPTPPDPPTPVVTNAVPTAVAGLVYDGTAKTGVAVGANYTIVGNVGTNAGDYVAVATVTNGVWEGGATGATNIAWTIAKAPAPDVSGVTFSGATYEYDGTERTIAVSGTVPAGVAVVYSGDPTNRTEVGTNTVTASFRVLDEANYEAITTTLTAKLVITAKEEPPVPPPPPPGPESGRLYADSEVGEFRTDAAATYNGWLRQGDTIVAAIQVKTSKARAGAPVKTSLSVTPVGGKKKTYKSTIVAKDGGLVDGYGVRYVNEELTGMIAGLPGVPEGATVVAAKDFSKSKVPAEKALMSGVPVGCRTLALPTAGGGYDCLSLTIDKKGKAKVKGTLDDGTSISLSVQGSLGSRSFVVPVVYSKNVSSKATGLKQLVTFAFLLWVDLKDDTAKISDETGGRWIGDERAISQSRTVVRPDDGYYGIRFEAPDAYLAASADGEPLTPNGERIAVVGKKWSADKSVGSVAYDASVGVYVKVGKGKTPANVSKFKMAYTEKTGLAKGSFKLYYLMPPKVKADSATVTGIAVDGVFYGNAVIKKKGLYAISWDRMQ